MRGGQWFLRSRAGSEAERGASLSASRGRKPPAMFPHGPSSRCHGEATAPDPEGCGAAEPPIPGMEVRAATELTVQ